MLIVSHRGINTLRNYTESSIESFEEHLRQNFGLEFDINFSKDNKIFILHDSNLTRITNGKNNNTFSNLNLTTIKLIKLSNGHFCDFDELMILIRKYNSIPYHFLHLKGSFQKKRYLNILINYLKKYRDILNKIIIFDVRPKYAEFLKSKIPNIYLAPSVAHQYDIKRFGKYTHNTLISISDAIKYKKLYDWVWLDEWDKTNAKNKKKKFYTKKNFLLLKKLKFKIGLVTPELHSLSPGLLGNESHQDAKNQKILFKRIKNIINLKPDALCTDYPHKIQQLTNIS